MTIRHGNVALVSYRSRFDRFFSSFNSISFYTTAYNFLKVVLFRLIYTNHTTEHLQHAIHMKPVMYELESKTLEAIFIQR